MPYYVRFAGGRLAAQPQGWRWAKGRVSWVIGGPRVASRAIRGRRSAPVSRQPWGWRESGQTVGRTGQPLQCWASILQARWRPMTSRFWGRWLSVVSILLWGSRGRGGRAVSTWRRDGILLVVEVVDTILLGRSSPHQPIHCWVLQVRCHQT